MSTSPPVDPTISKRTSGFGVRLGRTSGRPTFHAGLDHWLFSLPRPPGPE